MLFMPVTLHAKKRMHSLLGSYKSSTGKVFLGCTLDKPVMLMKTSARPRRQNFKGVHIIKNALLGLLKFSNFQIFDKRI